MKYKNIKNPKFFFGPMSFNIIEAIKNFSNENNICIGLIPSRRQVDYKSGYVMTTKEFNKLTSSSKNLIIERDHGGPNQGDIADSGLESLIYDCENNFDILHIDPWKQTDDRSQHAQSLEYGINKTIYLMRLLLDKNKNIKFEVGTEESIRKFEVYELDFLLKKLQEQDLIKHIKYLVVQGGTLLEGNKNIGITNNDNLLDFILLCKKFNLKSKEHNGDFLTDINIKEKFNLGLDAINIAPEIGFIESEKLSEIFLNYNKNIYNEYCDICYSNTRWNKWFKNSKPTKEEIGRMFGYYSFQNEKIKELKSKIENVDKILIDTIKNYLKSKIGLTK